MRVSSFGPGIGPSARVLASSFPRSGPRVVCMSPACTVSTIALTALFSRWLLLCFCLCASLLRVRLVAALVKVMVQVELLTWSNSSCLPSVEEAPLVAVVVASFPCVHCLRTCSSLACALTWVKMNETSFVPPFLYIFSLSSTAFLLPLFM